MTISPSSTLPTRPNTLLARLTLFLLALGILWRCIKYLLAMPVWGDEAMLGLNLLDRSFADLAKPLTYFQVAPPGFLAAEWSAFQLLGQSEYAIRLFPLLCGLLALLLFWILARQLLSPRGAMIALGAYAVGTYMARHAVEFKPYACDQLAAVALLLPAALWLKQGRLRWLYLLAAITIPAVCISFPAPFIVAGIAATLLLQFLHRRQLSHLPPLLLFTFAAALAFAAVYFLSIRGQYDSTGEFMRAYWKDSFPPANPLRLLWWLLDIHAGNMLAHPFGGKHFGSAGTLLLCLAGLWTLWHIRRSDPRQFLTPFTRPAWLLPLLLLPFALTLLAAAFQRYPYGGSARVAMHLAPAICLLLGLGASAIVALFPTPQLRTVASSSAAAILAIIALAGIARDFLQPYKTLPDEQARQFLTTALSQSPNVQVATTSNIPVNFLWYLRASHHPFTSLPPDTVAPAPTTLILCFAPADEQIIEQRLNTLHMRRRSRAEGTFQIGAIQDGPTWCSASVWELGPL